MTDKKKLAAVVAAASVGAALLLAALVFLALWLRRRRASVAAGRTRSLESSTATLRADDSSVSVSVSESAANPLPAGKRVAFWGRRGADHHAPLSVSGIPKYHYKDLQKATNNFTMILGQGSFGPVYKAVMATGEAVAVKALASDSSQGEREFHTEMRCNVCEWPGGPCQVKRSRSSFSYVYLGKFFLESMLSMSPSKEQKKLIFEGSATAVVFSGALELTAGQTTRMNRCVLTCGLGLGVVNEKMPVSFWLLCRLVIRRGFMSVFV